MLTLFQFGGWIRWAVHLTETRRVPQLRGKVPPFFDLFFVEANVLPARRNSHQAETQTIRSVFRNQIERVGRITKRLRHLATLLVANDPGEEHVVKRNVVLIAFGFSGLELQTGNDHARDPEENNVRTGDKNRRWIEFLASLRINRFIGTKPRRKPSIERV